MAGDAQRPVDPAAAEDNHAIAASSARVRAVVAPPRLGELRAAPHAHSVRSSPPAPQARLLPGDFRSFSGDPASTSHTARRRSVWQAIREATLTTALREDFGIVHLSLQRTHVHLIVEAANKEALARGMQGFQISAAKHLNRAISKDRPGPRRQGTVFPDRYYAEIITSPTQARHTLSYVMNNWRKHEEDRRPATEGWRIDWFSTSAMFPGWAEYGDEVFLWRGPPTYDPLVVYQPRTWLLREGWMRSKCGSCVRKTNLALAGRSGCGCQGQDRLFDEIFGCRSCRGKAAGSVTAAA